jgi:hypothetical protein
MAWNSKPKYKRQQIKTGAFIKVPFSKKHHTYARILGNACYAFYDCKTEADIDDLDKIASSPVLFIVAVYDSAITKGRWLKVGKLPLEDYLKTIPLKFIQDSIDSNKFRIYNPNTGKMRSASRAECEGLECASVWGPDHVEERLRAHYEERPSIWVEQLKIKD